MEDTGKAFKFNHVFSNKNLNSSYNLVPLQESLLFLLWEASGEDPDQMALCFVSMADTVQKTHPSSMFPVPDSYKCEVNGWMARVIGNYEGWPEIRSGLPDTNLLVLTIALVKNNLPTTYERGC
jgi:hypothetical protein